MIFKNIAVIVPRAMGVTLLCTAVLRQLKRLHTDAQILCICKFPELLINFPFVDKVFCYDEPFLFEMAIKDKNVIDLNGTLEFQPNRREKRVHLIDLLCERAKIINDSEGPECNLSEEELSEAIKIVNSVHRGKCNSIVAMTTRTTTPNKEWKLARWRELVYRTKEEIKWIHIGEYMLPFIPHVEYLTLTPRQSIAVLNYVDAVVCLDTFILHAAATQRLHTGNVIVLLGSTHPKCVSYESFINIYHEELDCQPCGRPYSQFDLNFLPDGSVTHWENGKPKKWECKSVKCMDLISVDDVEQALMEKISR